MDGWIAPTTGETANGLLTRLQGLELEVPKSSHSSTSIAYSANGLILRQFEGVAITEYRGLTKAAADLLCTLGSDTTQTTIYYKQIGTSDEYAAVGITTGGRTEYAASRANEANGWIVTKTEQTFSAAASTGWSTTRPSGATSTGIQTGKNSATAIVYTAEGDTLYATHTTTTTEYRFLSKSEADTKVANETSDSVAITAFTHSGTLIVTVYAQTGTVKTASSRYIDAERGYTVTVETTTHSASGTNWS